MSNHNSWWTRLSPTQKNVATVIGAAVGSFALAWIGLRAVELMRADMERGRENIRGASFEVSDDRLSPSEEPGAREPEPHIETPSDEGDDRESASVKVERPTLVDAKEGAQLGEEVSEPKHQKDGAEPIAAQPASAAAPRRTVPSTRAVPQDEPSRDSTPLKVNEKPPASAAKLPGSGLW